MIGPNLDDCWCYKHNCRKTGYFYVNQIEFLTCEQCNELIQKAVNQIMEERLIPPIPKEAIPKCNFCKEPCGNDWCCEKDKK